MTLKSGGGDVRDVVVRSCEHPNEPFGSVQRWGIFWLAEWLLAVIK